MSDITDKMIAKEAGEFHEHGCNFYGKLVIVDYQDDMKADSKYGVYNAGIAFDYLEKASKLVKEKYGETIEVLLSVPVLVVRIV